MVDMMALKYSVLLFYFADRYGIIWTDGRDDEKNVHRKEDLSHETYCCYCRSAERG